MIGLDELAGNTVLHTALPADCDHPKFTKLWSQKFTTRFAQDVPVEPGWRSVMDALLRKSVPLSATTPAKLGKIP